MIIDTKVESEPRTWHISKTNRIAPNGVARITLAQTYFDPHKDYIERDEDENIIGMWADYFNEGNILPHDPEEIYTRIYCEVSTTGKPEIKINDKFKKFTVDFFDEEGPIKYKEGLWSFSLKKWDKEQEKEIIIDLDTPELLSKYLQVKYYGEVKDLKENQIKIKYIGGMEYLDWILVVTFTEDVKKISSNIEINITRL